jgi:hypothetical protein
MWFDDLAPTASWTSLWSGYVLCLCGGIQQLRAPCPACDAPAVTFERQRIRDLDDGTEREVAVAFMGAEGRYEDYIYLAMLEREWKRPNVDHDWLDRDGAQARPSSRAAVVLLFWSYFETRVERLLRLGFHGVAAPLVEDTLSRYAAVGARLDRLYRVLFNTSYARDLEALGYADIWAFIVSVQERRNAFAHGNPRSIDDATVLSIVSNLKREHEAWIAVFNRRLRARREGGIP